MTNLKKLLNENKIIPILTIYNIQESLEIAKCLFYGGINILEVTLRTQNAWPAISLIKKTLPKLILGVGTVFQYSQLDTALKYDLDFAVSPVLSKNLISYAKKLNIAYIPSVETSTEVFVAKKLNCKILKLFPAQAINCKERLRHFFSIYNDIYFVPTGGLNKKNFSEYLKMENVISIGGSFMMPNDLVKEKKWDSLKKFVSDINSNKY